MQQVCRPLSESLNTFACYAVKGVTINVIIQDRSVIIKLNLIFCLISFLMIIKWLIMGESKEFSNYTFKNLKIMIFIKNWVLNYCSFWNSITSFLWLFHTSFFNPLQLSVNLVCLFNSFIKIVLTGCALLHTLPLFQGSSLKLFQW